MFDQSSKSDRYQHEARLYEAGENDTVYCHLCAHNCHIQEGKFGVCRVRQNIGGKLYTLTYGRTISQHADPVEKKPLYHFYPGSGAYSFATPGCNFHCRWCQNWEIAQLPRETSLSLPVGDKATPEQIVSAARRQGCRSIAYTYTEPTVFFEYAYDTAQVARQAGLANIYVTNGFMTEAMLTAFHPYLDAANVDLKSFRDETYKKYIGARLQPVLDSLKMMKQQGVWVEVTTLLVPGLNDSPTELRELAAFMVKELGADTPWHISRFFPNYQLTDYPPTPIETLQRAKEIGLAEGIHYVYLGNVIGQDDSDTHCPQCGRVLVRRRGFNILTNDIKEGRCPTCGTTIAGVGW